MWKLAAPVLLVLLLVACGDDAPAAETTSSSDPVATPTEPLPPPVAPAVEVEHPPAPTEARSLGDASIYSADVGGLVRHGNVLVRFGNGPTAVFGLADRARCTLGIEESVNTLPAGEWFSLTVTAVAIAPADAEYCAAFAGVYSSGHPSDPAAGGPPPPPTFEGSECWLRPQITSDGDAMCASFAGGVDAPTLAVDIYEGSCCVGAARATLTAPASARGFLLTSDGSTLVAALHDAMVMAEELATNPVLFQVITSSGTRELHVNELFVTDAVLTAGSSFGVEVRVEGSELVVATAGGDEHRHAL